MTGHEDLTVKQILEFIKYLNSNHTESDEEAKSMIQLINDVEKSDHSTLDNLEHTLALVATLSMIRDLSPGLSCWVIGFIMGVKFSNKEIVDQELSKMK